MYTLVASKRFRKQLLKLHKSDPRLFKKVEIVMDTLRLGKSLPAAKKDHKLTGRLNDFRECHVSPDWLLIYRQHDDILVLELLATGTHATLFE